MTLALDRDASWPKKFIESFFQHAFTCTDTCVIRTHAHIFILFNNRL